MHYKYFIASIGLKADLVLTRLALGFATAAAAAFRAVKQHFRLKRQL